MNTTIIKNVETIAKMAKETEALIAKETTMDTIMQLKLQTKLMEFTATVNGCLNICREQFRRDLIG